jgi:hypothetical protein
MKRVSCALLYGYWWGGSVRAGLFCQIQLATLLSPAKKPSGKFARFLIVFVSLGMAELLEKILTLPESERWELAQAILDSLKPPSEVTMQQARHAEQAREEWKASGHPGYTLDELTLLIEQKRIARGKKAS